MTAEDAQQSWGWHFFVSYTQEDRAWLGPLFERALRITETAYGPSHPHTATIRRNLKALDE